jgi:hypothetical protein
MTNKKIVEQCSYIFYGRNCIQQTTQVNSYSII